MAAAYTVPLAAPLTAPRSPRRVWFAATAGVIAAFAVGFAACVIAYVSGRNELLFVFAGVGVCPALPWWYRSRIRPRRTVAALAATLAREDRAIGDHCERVAAYSRRIARALGTVSRADEEAIVLAARIHDLGKLAVPPPVLHKAAPLNDAERDQMRAHPVMGETMLRDIGGMERATDVVRWHHERFAGGGYPDNLRGEQIPLAARIVAVADAWDAMLSCRPYQNPRSVREARAELLRCRGTHFDPAIVDAFVRSLDEATADAYADTDPVYIAPYLIPA